MNTPTFNWFDFAIHGINAFNSQKATNALNIAIHQHCVVAKVKTRKYNGLPYIIHPIRVALMVAAHPDCMPFWVYAAVNHDTDEDTVYNDEERAALKKRIITEVDEETYNLVIELTNVKHPGLNRKERKKLDWERLSKVSRPAKIIKMFDRIDNLREMVDAPSDFKKLYLYESRNIIEVLKDADYRLANVLRETIEELEKTV